MDGTELGAEVCFIEDPLDRELVDVARADTKFERVVVVGERVVSGHVPTCGQDIEAGRQTQTAGGVRWRGTLSALWGFAARSHKLQGAD